MIRLLEYLKRQNATFTFINEKILVKDESNKLVVEYLVLLDTVIYHRNAVKLFFCDFIKSYFNNSKYIIVETVKQSELFVFLKILCKIYTVTICFNINCCKIILILMEGEFFNYIIDSVFSVFLLRLTILAVFTHFL